MARPGFARFVAILALLALPIAVFYRPLFLGEAFVPGDLLGYVAPWSHTVGHAPLVAWNVLRYDGITQFYPWRMQAARSFHAGRIPFWNPYEFSASGGTPLLADSQSAPLYPLNALFYLFPIDRIWYVFGLTAAIHLTIAAAGMYRFLRRAGGLRRISSILGASTFALSAPVITWLALPTFLAVSCWIPWLLLCIDRAHNESDAALGCRAVVGAGLVTGLMLLAGHLQIAFYGILIAVLFTIYQTVQSKPSRNVTKLPITIRLAGFAGVATLGILLALPQMLPAFELSRVSHRAVAGPPSWDGYQSYIATAMPVRNLVTLLLPNFFGHPNPLGAAYWNTNNYGEWALYAGIVPLILAFYAVGLPWRSLEASKLPNAFALRPFFIGMAVLTLLLAMGTVADVPLFFLVPGYRQTGNPGRILVLFPLCVAALAAMGMEALLSGRSASRTNKERAAILAAAGPALLTAMGASAAAAFQREQLPGTRFAELIGSGGVSLVASGAVYLLTTLLLVVYARRNASCPKAVGALLTALTIGDLLVWGNGYNPSCSPKALFPITPGIAFLLKEAGPNDLIAPINQTWSLGKAGPRNAVLPPNALTVFGLHDIGGYDSLFRGIAKDQVRDAGGGEDPSPRENGNMVFIKSAETAAALGARFFVFPPDAPPITELADLRPVYTGDDLLIYENPRAAPFDPTAERSYGPASFRIGLFASLSALSGLAAMGMTALTGNWAMRRPRKRQ